MNPVPGQPRARPYWLLGALAVLLAIPVAWAGAALLAAAVGAAILAAVRSWAARRAGVELGAEPGVLLGSDQLGRAVRLSDQQLSAHGLILGASGAGKSTTLLAILTDQVRRGRPVVAIDMKGSPAFAATLAAAAAAAGRPFRRWTPDGPSHWNPLAHGNPTELKDRLIATERFTEPHYQRAAERYIQTALQVLQAAHPGRSPQLEELVGTMEPRRLSALLRQLPRPAAERVQDYLASLTPDQHSAIRGLGTRLALVSESHTGRYLSDVGAGDGAGGRGAIDLRAALAGEQVVLFSLNSGTYGQLSAQLGTLAIQDLVSSVGERLRAGERSPDGDGAGIEAGRGAGDADRPSPAIIAIDEFSALGSDNVIALLARAREAGVSVLLCTQELADLDRAAHGLRDQVLGNTAIKLAHRQDVPASAQTIAQMAGTEKAWEETRQLGGRLLAGHETRRGTRRQVEQFIVHPNEIKTLPPGEAVLISKLPPARARTVRVTAPQLSRPRGPARRGDELAR